MSNKILQAFVLVLADIFKLLRTLHFWRWDERAFWCLLTWSCFCLRNFLGEIYSFYFFVLDWWGSFKVFSWAFFWKWGSESNIAAVRLAFVIWWLIEWNFIRQFDFSPLNVFIKIRFVKSRFWTAERRLTWKIKLCFLGSIKDIAI